MPRLMPRLPRLMMIFRESNIKQIKFVSSLTASHEFPSQEAAWSGKVRAVLATYEQKAIRVDAHVEQLKQQIQELNAKREQLSNLKVQRKLERKLAMSTADLTK